MKRETKDGAARGALLCACGLLAVLLIAAAGGMARDAQAAEIARHAADRYFVDVRDVTNSKAVERMRHEAEKARAAEAAEALAGFREAERIAAEQAEAEAAARYEAEGYWEPCYVETAPDAGSYAPTGGLTKEGGVNYHDGRIETYYSSNVLYHKDTARWTVDDEGFYRDDQGRYVVAASDKAQGETFEGSKGECVVLDTGCAEGVTDYYVRW